MDEPANGSFVITRNGDDSTGGNVYHRDDREGHGDPADFPERWWWHDGHEWVSWNQIEVDAYTRGEDVELLAQRQAPHLT